MRVLGIDPGSRITGLGVVESSSEGLHSLFYDSVRLKDASLPLRLGAIYRSVEHVIREYSPDIVAVEQVFISNNAKSALVLGHARGSAICSAVNMGSELAEYSAKQIKQAVVGSGGATKVQIQHMVRVLLGLRAQPGADAGRRAGMCNLSYSYCPGGVAVAKSRGESMIGFLKGSLVSKLPPFLVLNVQGVGYELEAPMATFYDLPEEDTEVLLFTHLVVREDAHLLYGFSDRAQRELFRSLLKVNGVGPRVGLAILSTLSTCQFVQCVNQQDTLTLTSVPGIGKKTAERMLLDMRDRIGALEQFNGGEGDDQAAGGVALRQSPVEDAIGALMALGYKAADANRAILAVEESSPGRDDLIRNALQFLSKR